MRPPPKTVNGFTLNNSFALLPLNLNLIDNLETGLERIKKDMLAMKNSIQPIGYFYLATLTMQLPEFIRSALLENFCEKMSIGFSNVPGPKSPWVVGGKTVDTLGFFMPVAKSLCGSISIASHADTVKVGVVTD